jgi:3-(3-hydroxy-phenyl)propionate hydroxylase
MLAGDAAHLMPPFAGQGLGAGFRDAANLAWKLTRVLDGASDASLLDTYGPERKDHVKAFIDYSTSLGQVICLTDPAEAAERDERMMREWADRVEPPAPPRPTLGTGAHAGPHGGTLSPQGEVRVPGTDTPVRLDALTGRQPVLLLRSHALDISALDSIQSTADALGIALVTVADLGSTTSRAVTDVDATYTTWLAELRCAAVLTRPDFYVLDTAATPAEIPGLLDSFRHLVRHTVARASEGVSVRGGVSSPVAVPKYRALDGTD